MYRIVKLKILILVFTFFSSALAEDTILAGKEKSKTASQENQKTAEEVTQKYLDQLKSEELPSKKQKIVSELIDTVNKEANKYSTIVTKNISKILDAGKKNEGITDPNLVEEKDQNQAIYESWVSYKVALQPNYELFIEKNDKYTCNNIREQIWMDYTPLVPQKEKIEPDPATKKAIETSIEIAEELCKYGQDFL